MKTQSKTQSIDLGATIRINTTQGVATAKVVAKCPLDRVQILECSLPQFNSMIVDSEDIIEVFPAEEVKVEAKENFNPHGVSSFKEVYNELVLENQNLVKQNKKLKYHAELKDYAMGRAELWSKELREASNQKNVYRDKVYDLESKLSAMQIELDFLKERFKNEEE
ncbi:hypothetical protein [Bernardetia sp. MNP-M8]|uniref:hypothetical protein n=1 Tax=Bernardetia sp. MNP-M8 TaxID=3127470 RepID=UPI0030D1A480